MRVRILAALLVMVSSASACGVPDLSYTTTGSGGATTSTPTSTGASCGPGQKTCSVSCVEKTDPAVGCASASCAPCAVPGGVAACDPAGACSIASCDASLVDCEKDPAIGCVDTSSTADDCGACGHKCDATNTESRVCSAGACTSTCAKGSANCVLPTGMDDGCETDIGSDPAHCGDCMLACGGTRTCVDSVCLCQDNADCSPGAAPGMCNPGTHSCSCSGTACAPGERCMKKNMVSTCACNGKATCTANQTCCPIGCRDLTKNEANCGACGHACAKGFLCKNSVCACALATDCDAGTTKSFECAASGACVCEGKVCPFGQRCQLHGECG